MTASPGQHEPTNADLYALVISHHSKTDEKIASHHGAIENRLKRLEHHLIDTDDPDRTLPSRVKRLEAFHRTVKWTGSTFFGGLLIAGGAWVWDRVRGGHP